MDRLILLTEIKQQAAVAIEDADVIIFVVDGTAGVTQADLEVSEILRRSQKMINGVPYPPIILAVNKAEHVTIRDEAYQFYELGMGEPYAISAMHGTSTGDLLDAVVENLSRKP